MEQWTDAQGKPFKGEPAEVLGPLALFRQSGRTGKLVPLGQMSEKDCIRFAEQVRGLARPATDWAQSKTGIGSEIFGAALRVDGDNLKSVELKGRPEPRFYVLYYVSNGEGKSWGTLGKTGWHFQELQRRHPKLVEGFMYGVKHSYGDQKNMATSMKVPFLVSNLDAQGTMEKIQSLVPSTGFGLVVTNCNGVPIYMTTAETDETAKAVFKEFSGLLDVIRVDNPAGWNDSECFWKTVQPKLHATDKCDPLLVGDPLNAAKLRELGVDSFDATIYVSPEGKVTGVKIAEGPACPPDLVQPLSEALYQARIVSAVDQGKFVAGAYQYHFGAKN